MSLMDKLWYHVRIAAEESNTALSDELDKVSLEQLWQQAENLGSFSIRTHQSYARPTTYDLSIMVKLNKHGSERQYVNSSHTNIRIALELLIKQALVVRAAHNQNQRGES